MYSVGSVDVCVLSVECLCVCVCLELMGGQDVPGNATVKTGE